VQHAQTHFGTIEKVEENKIIIESDIHETDSKNARIQPTNIVIPKRTEEVTPIQNNFNKEILVYPKQDIITVDSIQANQKSKIIAVIPNHQKQVAIL